MLDLRDDVSGRRSAHGMTSPYPICRYRIRPAIVNTLSGNRAKTDFAHRTFKRSRRRDEATIGARQVVRVEHSADQRPLNAIRPGLSMSERPKSSSSSPCLFGLFDCLPEQHRRTAKAIEMGIGAAVLIYHLLSMADGQDTGNGPAGFGGDSNTGILPHPCHETSETIRTAEVEGGVATGSTGAVHTIAEATTGYDPLHR